MVGLSSSIKPIGSIMAIDAVNLGRVDLNLLVHLDALLTERSVTRAAARVGIGQSAMSHNLARLRELFSDELLTRGPEGLRLTPRAATLVEPVRTALFQIQTLVSRDEAFDPATAERSFRFGLADSTEIWMSFLLSSRACARSRPVSTYESTTSTLLGSWMISTLTNWTSPSALTCSRRDKPTTNGVCC